MTRIRDLLSPLAALALVTASFSIGCSGSDGDRGPAGPAGQQGGDGKEGPEGKPGTGGDPSVSAVQPGRVFLDRTLDVAISGFGTVWTDGATADFGPGITVNKVTVASTTGIVANITIDAKAMTGVRDVSVKEGSATTTFKGAFKVDAPLAVGDVLGLPSQGSILLGSANELDISTPFDTTQTGDGLFTPISYPNLSLAGGAGVGGSIDSAQPYSLAYTMFIDVDAAAGMNDVEVVSGDTHSAAPGALTVAARTPTDLTGATTGTAPAALETLLYKYTAAANPQLVTISVSSADMTAAPAFVLLPTSGHFADLISYADTATFTTHPGDSFYVVYFDNSGAAGYDFDVAFSAVDLADETEPNETCGGAQAVAVPVAVNATLADGADQDWFAITATAADVGKVVHVVTSPGDADTDTFVDVVLANCVTSLGGPSGDADYHENFTSDPIPAAGTYYVSVTNSPTYPFAGSAYTLSISFETPAL